MSLVNKLKIKKVVIEIIPHKKQRYDTVGDWYMKKNVLHIKVSKLNNTDYEYLIAGHEYDEAYMCLSRGVKEKDVTKFDKDFEKNRKKGDLSEPGDHPDAPYHNEHLFATYLEKLRADELNVVWADYEDELNNL